MDQDPSSQGTQTEHGTTATDCYAGPILLDRYEVIGEAGRGGMGVVYCCRDRLSDRLVAIKRVPKELEWNPSTMEQIRRNFQLVERLHHPHIAAMKTIERDPSSGAYFLVMEYVKGRHVRAYREQLGGKMELPRIIALLRPVAEALDYAHRERIVHRDIKPENLMVNDQDQVKILDFGIAGQFHDTLSALKHARHDSSGTRPYMAPEQWRGEYQNAATDQYALAVVVYELLTGTPPFTSKDPDALREAVLQHTPARPEGLSQAAWNALSRGLAKQRNDRHVSCVDMMNALAGSRRNLTQPLVATAVVAFLAAGLLLAVVPDRTKPRTETPAIEPATDPVTDAAAAQDGIAVDSFAYSGTDPFPAVELQELIRKEIETRGVTTAAAGSAAARFQLSGTITEQKRSWSEGSLGGRTFTNEWMVYRISMTMTDRLSGESAHTNLEHAVVVEQAGLASAQLARGRQRQAAWRRESIESLGREVVAWADAIRSEWKP